MLGGAYYIWIMLGFFLSCGGLVLFVALALWIGHWMMKRETGEKHGFLELPENLRSTPVDESAPPTEPAEVTGPQSGESAEPAAPDGGEENQTPP